MRRATPTGSSSRDAVPARAALGASLPRLALLAILAASVWLSLPAGDRAAAGVAVPEPSAANVPQTATVHPASVELGAVAAQQGVPRGTPPGRVRIESAPPPLEPLPRSFLSPDECLANSGLNPQARVLDAEKRAAFERLLVRLQGPVAENRERLLREAHERVRTRIDAGQAVADQGRPVDAFGAGELRLHVSMGGSGWILDFHRGEDATMDRLYDERDMLLAAGYEEVRRFLADAP